MLRDDGTADDLRRDATALRSMAVGTVSLASVSSGAGGFSAVLGMLDLAVRIAWRTFRRREE